MRQLLNVSYIAQAETKIEEGELERWEADLERPLPRTSRAGRTSRIDGRLAGLMPLTGAV